MLVGTKKKQTTKKERKKENIVLIVILNFLNIVQLKESILNRMYICMYVHMFAFKKIQIASFTLIVESEMNNSNTYLILVAHKFFLF